MPADLSSISSKSTRLRSLPSPKTVSYSSITLGLRSGYIMRSCQQSITMADIGPSCGLNTPNVMQAVGSFCAFSEVATS